MPTLKRSLSQSSAEHEENRPRRIPSHKWPNVYDATAGRVYSKATAYPSPNVAFRPTATQQALRPDEVLFKAKNAPTRYEEADYYFAHSKLPQDQPLPDGQMLRALHSYIANYYARSEEQVDAKVFKSMDETALLALGILLEETAREELGETGDLALVEGAAPGEGDDSIPRERIGVDHNTMSASEYETN